MYEKTHAILLDNKAFRERTATETVTSEELVVQCKLVLQELPFPDKLPGKEKILIYSCSFKNQPFFLLKKKNKGTTLHGSNSKWNTEILRKVSVFPKFWKNSHASPTTPSRGLPRHSLFAFSPNIF